MTINYDIVTDAETRLSQIIASDTFRVTASQLTRADERLPAVAEIVTNISIVLKEVIYYVNYEHDVDDLEAAHDTLVALLDAGNAAALSLTRALDTMARVADLLLLQRDEKMPVAEGIQ